MPAPAKEGVSQVNAELPTAFLDEVKRFSEARGEKLRETIYHALRRHLKYPPPPIVLPAEPLPDSPTTDAGSGYGEVIRQLREGEDCPLTVEYFAELCGFTPERLRAIEAGAEPTHAELCSIEEATNNPVAFLNTEEHEMLMRGRQAREKLKKAARKKK